MRAIKLIRATLAAAVLAGATFSAACAVEDEAVVDDLEETVADDVKGDEVAAKALTVTLGISQRCEGASTEYTLIGHSNQTGTAFTYYMSHVSASGPWTAVGSGAVDIINVTGSRRYFYAKGCKSGVCDNSPVSTRNSSCNMSGGGGGPIGGDPGDGRDEP